MSKKSDLTMPLLFLAGGAALLFLLPKKATGSTAALNTNVTATLPPNIQGEIARVLQSFGVDDKGIVKGPVTTQSINAATTLALGLDSMGYRDAAATVRQYIVLAQDHLKRQG